VLPYGVCVVWCDITNAEIAARRGDTAATHRDSAERKGSAMTAGRRKADTIEEARVRQLALLAELDALAAEAARRDAEIRAIARDQFERDQAVGGIEAKLSAMGHGAFVERHRATAMAAAANFVRLVQARAGRRRRLTTEEFAVIEHAHKLDVPVRECDPTGRPWSLSVPVLAPTQHALTSRGTHTQAYVARWCADHLHGSYHLSRPKWRLISDKWDYCAILTCQYEEDLALARLWLQ
jgi:hypothetical protein